MRIFSVAVLALALVPVTAQAQAQEADGDQIVVTGVPDDPAAITEFVDAASSRTADGHIARWNSPICPEVTGLRDDLANYVEQTVTAVAQAVGARAQSGDCDANIVIVFMREPSEFVETLRRQRPAHLASLDLRERQALASSSAAARSWSVNEFRTRDGRIVQQSNGPNIDGNFEQGGSRGVASRISNDLRADFSTVYMLIDLDQMEGVTMQQLSAFVALEALTAADSSASMRSERTILSLFRDGADAPADLTDWDVAYLRALYATEPAQAAETQRSAITGQMRDLLTAGPGD